MSQQPLLPNENPLQALCRHFNVVPVTYPAGQPLPPTFDMPILRDAHMPTHVLAIFDTPENEQGPAFQPLMAPIHAELFARRFRLDVIPQSTPGSILPVPHCLPGSQTTVVTLPVVPLRVPHAPSVPLLLLFALNPRLRPGAMAWHLLPPNVIEEFPSAAAMTQMMISTCSDSQLREYATSNHGLWKNILALGPRDSAVIEMIQTAWNVTADARRIRYRA